MDINLLIALLLGCCAGSFVCATVYRIKHKKNWVSGRSQCEHCGHKLGPFDLVPIFSWIILKGKCRYCHHKIGAEPVVMELVTGFLFGISYYFWPYAYFGVYLALLVLWLVLLVGLIALALYDYQYMELPNGLVIFASITTVIWIILHAMGGKSIIPNLMGGFVLCGFFYLLWIISKGKWIGGGDVKLSFSLGLLAGSIPGALLLLLFASLFGTLYGLPLLLSKNAKKQKHIIPFGPFLIISTLIVFLWGNAILKLLYIN